MSSQLSALIENSDPRRYRTSSAPPSGVCARPSNCQGFIDASRNRDLRCLTKHIKAHAPRPSGKGSTSRAIAFGRMESVSAQGIECSYPGRAAVKWMRRLSGKKGTEFSPRVPIISQIFPFCPLFRVISYLRHCCGTRIFKFGPIVSHSCFSWCLGRPCLCGCWLTPAGAQ